MPGRGGGRHRPRCRRQGLDGRARSIGQRRGRSLTRRHHRRREILRDHEVRENLHLQDKEPYSEEHHEHRRRGAIVKVLGDRHLVVVHHTDRGDPEGVADQGDRDRARRDRHVLPPLETTNQHEHGRQPDEDRQHLQAAAGIDHAEDLPIAEDDPIAVAVRIEPDRLQRVGADDGRHSLQRPQEVAGRFVGQRVHEDQAGERSPGPAEHAPAAGEQKHAHHRRHKRVHVDRHDAVTRAEQPQREARHQQTDARGTRRWRDRPHRFSPPEEQEAGEHRHDPAVLVLRVVPDRWQLNDARPVTVEEHRQEDADQDPRQPLLGQPHVGHELTSSPHGPLKQAFVFDRRVDSRLLCGDIRCRLRTRRPSRRQNG